jgi:homogentisate 1,2-dioxygenase
MEDPPTFIDEVAVMVDTRSGLTVSEAATGVENTAYVDSWKSPGAE